MKTFFFLLLACLVLSCLTSLAGNGLRRYLVTFHPAPGNPSYQWAINGKIMGITNQTNGYVTCHPGDKISVRSKLGSLVSDWTTVVCK